MRYILSITVYGDRIAKIVFEYIFESINIFKIPTPAYVHKVHRFF